MFDHCFRPGWLIKFHWVDWRPACNQDTNPSATNEIRSLTFYRDGLLLSGAIRIREIIRSFAVFGYA